MSWLAITFGILCYLLCGIATARVFVNSHDPDRHCGCSKHARRPGKISGEDVAAYVLFWWIIWIFLGIGFVILLVCNAVGWLAGADWNDLWRDTFGFEDEDH